MPKRRCSSSGSSQPYYDKYPQTARAQITFPPTEMTGGVNPLAPTNEYSDTGISLAIPPQDPTSNEAWVAELLQIDYEFDPEPIFGESYATIEPPSIPPGATVAWVTQAGFVALRACVRTAPIAAFPNMYTQQAQQQFCLGDPKTIHAWKMLKGAGTGEQSIYIPELIQNDVQSMTGSVDLTDDNGHGILVPGPNIYLGILAMVHGPTWKLCTNNSASSTPARTHQFNWKIYFRYRKVALQEYLQMVQWASTGFP